MRNYVSKFKKYIGVQTDYYDDDDNSFEGFVGNVENEGVNSKTGKMLSRDVLKNYVLKKANTFRNNLKKRVDGEEDDEIEDDDEGEEERDNSEDDDADDDDDNDDDNNDDDDDIEYDDEDDNEASDNLDLLINQHSKYTASIKLKEVLIGNQCTIHLCVMQ